MNEKYRKKIEKLKEYSFSGKDLMNAVDGKTIIYTYPQLLKYKKLDDLFDENGSIVILYLTSHNYGHWCCLNKINDKLIEFFDPYGYIVDSEREFIPKHIRKELNECCPYLSKLMYDSPYILSYNDHKFQKSKENINTCGRHCATRINFKNVPLYLYKKFFDSLKDVGDPDTIVTILTSYI